MLKEETEFKLKPIVRIGNKQILWHIMKIYSHFGFNDFIITLGYKGEYIRKYFSDKNNRENFNIDLIDTDVHPRSKYGLVTIKKIAKKLTEKPVLKEWINGGFMIFKKEFFEK